MDPQLIKVKCGEGKEGERIRDEDRQNWAVMEQDREAVGGGGSGCNNIPHFCSLLSVFG